MVQKLKKKFMTKKKECNNIAPYTCYYLLLVVSCWIKLSSPLASLKLVKRNDMGCALKSPKCQD